MALAHICDATLPVSSLALAHIRDATATDLVSCTCTHTWCYATDLVSCTCTHTWCYATYLVSCTCTRRDSSREHAVKVLRQKKTEKSEFFVVSLWRNANPSKNKASWNSLFLLLAFTKACKYKWKMMKKYNTMELATFCDQTWWWLLQKSCKYQEINMKVIIKTLEKMPKHTRGKPGAGTFLRMLVWIIYGSYHGAPSGLEYAQRSCCDVPWLLPPLVAQELFGLSFAESRQRPAELGWIRRWKIFGWNPRSLVSSGF